MGYPSDLIDEEWNLIRDEVVFKNGYGNKRWHDHRDSKSVKTTGAAKDQSIDGGKKVKGRKRHIVTDMQGHLLHVKVHAANVHDTVAGCGVFEAALQKYPSILGVCADQSRVGRSFPNAGLWIWLVKGVQALAKNVEILVCTAENFVRVAHVRLLLKRICNRTINWRPKKRKQPIFVSFQ